MRLVPLLLLLAACDSNLPPRASALRVETRSQLIGGPKALGQIGDYLLENDKIRVIIQGIEDNSGAGRSNTLFGGSLIDADLQRPSGSAARGNDQMGELLPALNLEVLQPSSIRITADGANGGAAVVTVRGKGADLLQMVATMSKGLLFSPDLEFKQEYRLEPGKSYVELVTSVTNNSSADHPLPFLMPSELKNAGIDIPGVENLEFSVPFGHLMLFGGENQLFAPGAAGFNLRYAIIGTYPMAQGFPAYPGLVAEFIATRGRGVSYGLAVLPSDDNYPSAYKSLYEKAQQPVTDHSILMPYVYSAVTGVFSHNPPRFIKAGGTYSYTTYFFIGRGDVASVVDAMHVLRGTKTGSFAGRVVDEKTQAPVEHAMVAVLDASGVIDEADTDANGNFKMRLPPGDYSYRVVTNVRDTTPPRGFQIAQGQTKWVLERLLPPARLALQIVDEVGRPVPCKVSLIGHYSGNNAGQDPRTFLYDLRLGEHERPTTFDRQRTEFIEDSWYTTNGLLNVEARPGTYDLAVMRGLEYDLHQEPLMLGPGSFVSRRIALRRAAATPGYVSADLHLHMANSTDSSLTLEERVASLAGEGLEFATSSDHNFITDYAPAIASLGLENWFSATIGLELTTFEMGHFNAYPLRLDPGNVRGGDYVWGGQTPASLFKQMRALGEHADQVLLQVNHARDGVLGYFTQFNLDGETGEVAPRSGLRAVFAPFKPEFAPEQFSYDFDALEVLGTKRLDLAHNFVPPGSSTPLRNADGRIAYPGQIDDWFTFLSRGKTYTAVGNSDSHTTLGQEPGYPRNLIWVGEGKDEQGKFTTADVVAGIKAHRVVVTDGPMIELTVDGQPIGSLVRCDDSADVAIHVTAPNWSPFDKVKIWMNGAVAREYAVPDAEAHDFTVSESLALTRDAWIAVEVLGSANLFPVVPPQEFEPLDPSMVINALGAGFDFGGLGATNGPKKTEIVTPIALTNAVWCDRDGNGKFDPPRPPIMKKAPPALGDADVRRAFAAVPEVSP